VLNICSRARAGWAWWYMPVIPALRRLKQEDLEFEASLFKTVRPCLK
jgi:hypothetical protein